MVFVLSLIMTIYKIDLSEMLNYFDKNVKKIIIFAIFFNITAKTYLLNN